jgi:hypothetical protein
MKVWARPVSLAATQGIIVLFFIPQGTEMFHFPWFPPSRLYIRREVTEVYSAGFPHSEIFGSKVACHLPEAYRRLLRPSSAPRCQAIHRTPFRASTIRIAERRSSADGRKLRCTCLQALLTLKPALLCLAHITYRFKLSKSRPSRY